ncbi:MAG: ribosome-associated translation inhibitor RaiA [Pseudobacteriovorax sp.]|nr:ribosome-associated translation inhibitor RaiA [Pseudobacteriovorax sp.]
MQFQFSFKHMETSQAIQDYAREKLSAKIEKFVTKAIEVQVTFSVDRHIQQAVCTLIGGDGFSLTVEHSCGDMYGSIDLMADKLGTQLKKKKDRLKGHKNRSSVRDLPMAEASDDDLVIDADDVIKFEQAKRRKTGT